MVVSFLWVTAASLVNKYWLSIPSAWQVSKCWLPRVHINVWGGSGAWRSFGAFSLHSFLPWQLWLQLHHFYPFFCFKLMPLICTPQPLAPVCICVCAHTCVYLCVVFSSSTDIFYGCTNKIAQLPSIMSIWCMGNVPTLSTPKVEVKITCGAPHTLCLSSLSSFLFSSIGTGVDQQLPFLGHNSTTESNGGPPFLQASPISMVIPLASSLLPGL